MTEDTIKRRARGLDRAFDILDFLKEKGTPLRPNEIATGISSPKSTVYELVSSLLERRILETVGKDGHVYLGRQLYFLGQAHLRHFDFTREAETSLAEIVSQTRETAQMCLLNGRKYTVALMKEGERHFRISSDIGENAPIPWTASGRLLLNHLSDQEISDLIDPDDYVLPSGELLPMDTFLREIRQAGEDGFFSFDSVADTFTHCFAAPVKDERGICVATLCIVAPRADAKNNYSDYRRVLIDSANGLARRVNE
ncbi:MULTISPECIES: IclR family transcriptional regulator [unclassified Pseudomonas]|uniref:IclR family transcriptional regulator n=1 Tax=unclassified Pseudomonas TaxID=196821 RepID=UPI002AC8B8CB|nr:MULTISPECIES: IclR family transcriptional regulator [unclassified Pseudomonas]MEB0042078.1 IclR family transcriptional regulator [Pseudomonas sp. MH10]MEB0076537.1 IclR family transcriptional regulator [Pseudomonas sp. MH10out]MEB0091285.1 IclR family transcriptional regulator [Pseudomonas sp. CCI4.2]MEB0101493.1 IclR family transcriptional regulator [Pseudomonas sp. CCI3.2]MEB0119776.1 IclR family transcriptional regulator [Pseudomonas sp. CCI1.2]